MAAALTAGALYLRRPIRRLLRMRSPSAGMPPLASRSPLAAELALIPLIRLTGDVAKMLGYPLGIAWRLGHPRVTG